MRKYLIMLIFFVLIFGCSKNTTGVKDYYLLYKNVIAKNNYQVFKNITFVKRKESNSYLYYNRKYNLSYWFSINPNNSTIDEFDEKLKKANSEFLVKHYPKSSQEIEKKLMVNINFSTHILMKYHLTSINGWKNRDSLQIIDFTFNSGSDLVYFEKISLENLKSFGKNKIVEKMDNNWYYIK